MKKFFQLQFTRILTGQAPFTRVMLIIVFIGCFGLGGLYKANHEVGIKIYSQLVFNLPSISAPWSIFPGILTSWMLHVGLSHLLINMLGLALILPSLEQAISGKDLLFRMLVWNTTGCVVVAAQYAISHPGESESVVGASCIVYGAAGWLGVHSANKKIWGIPGWAWSILFLSQCLLDFGHVKGQHIGTGTLGHVTAWTVATVWELISTRGAKQPEAQLPPPDKK